MRPLCAGCLVLLSLGSRAHNTLHQRQLTLTTVTTIRTTHTLSVPVQRVTSPSTPRSVSSQPPTSLASSVSSAFSSAFVSFSPPSSHTTSTPPTSKSSPIPKTRAPPVSLPTPLVSTPPAAPFPSNALFSSTSLTPGPSTYLSQGGPSLPSPVVPVEATSSGFWNNKGAVGGTFAVVGLIALSIVVFSVVVCIKRNRARKYDEELFGGSFDREHSQHASTPDAGSLCCPAMDPFAAGEVIQVHRSSDPFTPTSGIATGLSGFRNLPQSSSDHGHTSTNDHTSSNGHLSSNHHGFSNISYYTALSGSHGNLNRTEPPLCHQPQNSPASASSYRPGRLYDPPSHEAAVPRSVTSTFTAPSLYLGAGRVNKIRQPDSDASYYADRIHSYYYGAGATAPPPARAFD